MFTLFLLSFCVAILIKHVLLNKLAVLHPLYSFLRDALLSGGYQSNVNGSKMILGQLDDDGLVNY